MQKAQAKSGLNLLQKAQAKSGLNFIAKGAGKNTPQFLSQKAQTKSGLNLLQKGQTKCCPILSQMGQAIFHRDLLENVQTNTQPNFIAKGEGK